MKTEIYNDIISKSAMAAILIILLFAFFPVHAADRTPPVISNIETDISGTSVTITWQTDEASDSVIEYGSSKCQYNQQANESLMITNHSVTLNDLTEGTEYHYRISSFDASGNIRRTNDLTFTTDVAESTISDQLVAHWKMDPGTGRTVPDVSGNNHQARLRNGATLSNNGGVVFDGINDVMDAGIFNVTGQQMTIAGWFWADDFANCPYWDCRIISKATGTREQRHFFMVSTIKLGSDVRLRFRLKTDGNTSTLNAGSGNLQENTWVHFAVVYDGQAMRIFKDGIEVGSMAKTGNITANDSSYVWLGGNPKRAKARPWKGMIDDVRVYNYALSKSEITQLMNE